MTDDDRGAPPLDDLFDDFFCLADQEVGEISKNDVEEVGSAEVGALAGGGGPPAASPEARKRSSSVPSSETSTKRSRTSDGG